MKQTAEFFADHNAKISMFEHNGFYNSAAAKKLETKTDYTQKSHLKFTLIIVIKLLVLLILLFLFVCSLDFLSNSFRLIGGRLAGKVFSKSVLINNPIVGLMIGCMVTLLVQSSSTSTSIIVSMISSGILKVQMCVPMIMGANIGTSVTNTLVSLTQIAVRSEFQSAFSGAVIHDMYNWMCVIVLLPIELFTRTVIPSGQGYLEYVSDSLLSITSQYASRNSKINLLKVITKPITKLIIQTDKRVLRAWAQNDTSYANASLIKRYCDTSQSLQQSLNRTRCQSLFSHLDLSDRYAGLILMTFSLLTLAFCLIFIVKTLHSMLRGTLARTIKRMNNDLPCVPWLSGYLAIVVGCVMTILVQSSSVFTSAITPLVGIGVISLERMYPLTIGSNIGTTTTALLAALASSSSPVHILHALQIALVHMLFNLHGILLFYIIPFTRVPIFLARRLGTITSNYRWFAFVYLIGMFIFLPSFVLLLSFAGQRAFYAVFIILVACYLSVCLIHLCQHWCPNYLPLFLRTWDFLPIFFRSLQPYDRVFTKIMSTLRMRMFCCIQRPDQRAYQMDLRDSSDPANDSYSNA